MSEAESNQENPSPLLGDSLNKTITLTDEERIGGNIYKNLQKSNYIINDILVSDYIAYLAYIFGTLCWITFIMRMLFIKKLLDSYCLLYTSDAADDP